MRESTEEPETGLLEILTLSYFTFTATEFLHLCLDLSNENLKLVNQNKKLPNAEDYVKSCRAIKILNTLDENAGDTLGNISWKDTLRGETFGDMTHYQEFLAFRPGGCQSAPCIPAKKCKECKKDLEYNDKPSGLLELIRNIHEHAIEKMLNTPNGVVKSIMFPKGYSDKQAFVEYWLERFPKVFHYAAALERDLPFLDVDTAVDKLRYAIDMEILNTTRKLVSSYVCKLSNGKQFKLDVLVLDHVNPQRSRIEHDLNKLVKVENCSLTVQHMSCEPLKYTLALSNREAFNIVLGVDLLQKQSCEYTDRVVLLVESKEGIDEAERRLRKFAVFTLETALKGYVDRWLIGDEEKADMFRPQPGTVYLILHPYERLPIPNYFISATVGRLPFLKELIDYSYESVVEAQRIEGESNFHALTETDSNVICLDGNVSTYENVYNKLQQLCGDQPLRLIRHRKDDQSKVSIFTFLTPERDLTSNITDKLVFVSAGAGEGKTALLEHYLFSGTPSETTVLHTTARKLVDSPMDGKGSVMEVVASSVAPLEFESEDSNVLLLIDAMDEVETRNTKRLQKVIQELTLVPRLRVIVSMRSYLEGKIKKEYPTSKIFKLAVLARSDQKAIILKHWKFAMGRAHLKIKGLEGNASRLLNIYEDQFELTPLHCRLLAEIYVDKVMDCTEFYVDYSIIEIYKTIVLKNFHRYLLEKMNVDMENQGRAIYERLKEEYNFAHVYLATKQLCTQHSDNLKEALAHPNIKLTPGQGFLHNIDPVIFTHLTFAEYFVDHWAFQVLVGDLELGETELKPFSEFFMARYLQAKENTFLNTMLENQESSIYFAFELKKIDIMRIYEMCYQNCEPCLIRLIVNSLAAESRDSFSKRINEYSDEHVELIGRELPYRFTTSVKIPLPTAFLLFSAVYGYYDLLHLLLDLNVPFPIYENGGKQVQKNFRECSTLLHSVLTNSRENPALVINEKKKIILLVLKSDPNCLNYSTVDGNTPNLSKCMSFQLYRHLIDTVKKQIEASGSQMQSQDLERFLLQTNYRRENVFHQNYADLEFLSGFKTAFPNQYYRLANAIDCEGKSLWMKCMNLCTHFPEQVDFCVRLLNGTAQYPGRYFPELIRAQISMKHRNGISSLTTLGKRMPSWVKAAQALQQNGLIGEGVSEKIATGAFESLLGAFEECALSEALEQQRIEELVKSFPNEDELASYYLAIYIRDQLRDTHCSVNDEFQDLLLGTVLATDGIKFRHTTCCHLLNDLIAEDNLEFKLSEKHVMAMCVNDSSFIVSCKTAHVNIAKVLAQSFTVEWLSCLDDFQLMCVFRALDQHCGDFIEEIVAKLADHQFVIPINTVQETLITGNLKVFKLYVEQLGFNDIQESVHLIFENSSFDQAVIIKRKKEMIAYIRKEFSGAVGPKTLLNNIFRGHCDRAHPDFKMLCSEAGR